MARLTKRMIDSLTPGERDSYIWDGELPGFGLRFKPSGRKSFIFQYRNAEGISRRMTVGDFGPLTVEQARKKAEGLRAQVRDAKDPARDKREMRDSPTIRDLAQRYMREHCQGRCKESTIEAHTWLLDRFILPELGPRKISFIVQADIQKLHHKLAPTPYNANRVLGLIRAMFNHAERWGLRPLNSNPTRHIQKFRETKRARFLSPTETQTILGAIGHAENTAVISTHAAAALRLLFFTGCRLGEILTLRWDQIDLEGKRVEFREHKTDEHGAKSIPLNGAAFAVLCNVPRIDKNPYVIAKPGTKLHLINLRKPWLRVLKMAGFESVRIHDIRHTFASLGIASGLSLPIIGGLLGHRSHATTARYAHLSNDPLREASLLVGKAFKTPQVTAANDNDTSGLLLSNEKGTQ